MAATWCPQCFVGQWKCLYPLMELPTSAHVEILAYLDGLSATFLGQTSMDLLQLPAPECALTPVPAFMALNGMKPKGRLGTLHVRHIGRALHFFAVRAAGVTSMVSQIHTAIGLGWSQAEYLHPWFMGGLQRQFQRRAVRDVISLRVSLSDASTVTYLNEHWPEVVQPLRDPGSSCLRPLPEPSSRIPRHLELHPKAAPTALRRLQPHPPDHPPPGRSDVARPSRTPRPSSQVNRNPPGFFDPSLGP